MYMRSRSLVNIISVCACLAAFVCICWAVWALQIVVYDPYWHLAMGREALSGRDPSIDSFSFTFLQKPVEGYSWHFGFGFYGLAELVGLPTASIILRGFGLAAVTLPAVFLAWHTDRQHIAAAALALALIFAGLNSRFFLRPELLDCGLLCLSFYLYHCALQAFTARVYIAIALLLVAWTNFHASILGYVVFAGLYAQLFYDSLSNRGLDKFFRQHFGPGILLVLLGFANRELQHPLIQALSFSSTYSELISEHYTFIRQYDYALAGPIYLLWPLFLLVLFLCIRSGQLGLALILLVYALAAWFRVRLISFFCISMGFCLLQLLQSHKDLHTHQDDQNPLDLVLQATFALIAVMLSLFSFQLVDFRLKQPSNLPRDTTEYIRSHHSGGNILNTMHWGGWLIYELAPDFKVHIDGRTNILYPLHHLQESIAMENGDDAVLRATLDKYRVDLILFRPQKQSFESITLSSDFRPEFITDTAILYSKTATPLSISALLLTYPMCWDPGLEEQLGKEGRTAASLYPAEHLLPRVVGHIASAGDLVDPPVEWLNFSRKQQLAIAYATLLSGNAELSARLFSIAKNAEALDLLASAYAAYQAEDWPQVKKQTLLVLSGFWSELHAPAAKKPTEMQLEALVFLGEKALKEVSDPELDPLLRKAIDANKKVETEQENGPILLYRSHCTQLVDRLLGNPAEIDFQNVTGDSHKL